MLTRRTFLLAAGAGAGLALSGCGSGPSSNETQGTGAAGSDDGTAGTAVDDGGTTPPGVYDLVRRFPITTLVPGRVRLPMSLGRDGVPLVDGPDELRGRIVDEGGTVVVDELVATKRSEGMPNAYWAFVADLPDAGIYTLLVDGAAPQGAAFQLNDPSTVAIPLVGQPLPPVDTPTVADGRGVDPICTRVPPCPLHDVTLAEALASGTPVAYLIGTPAYCSTGVCGPILDLLLELRDEFGDIAFVHADVYADDTLKTIAPAVTAYALDFEPVLFVADATGTLVARLDAVFDQSEMREALQLVS
jgi:hypothetical protein